MTLLPWHAESYAGLLADRERMPHALLLQGPRGIGKLAFAETLANLMLCEAPRGHEPCGTCQACHWFAQQSHPDFKRIEPAEPDEEEEGGGKKASWQIAIKDVRSLGEFLSLAPHQGGWRVVLLHPAEAMNVAAANALLKTLEEPPARVLLILVSHQPRRLLPTVLSRCRKLALPQPDWDAALAWLRKQSVDDPETLLREAGGAPLVALEYADKERLERRKAFIDALAEADLLVLSGLGNVFQSRLDEAWGWLTRWAHDLVRIRKAGEARYFPERIDTLRRIAASADLEEMLLLEAELRGAGRWLRHPLNGQLLLESWLLRYGALAQAKTSRGAHG